SPSAGRLQELDTIAEWITCKEALPTFERLFVEGVIADALELRPKPAKVFDRKRHMRLARRPEIKIDADVQLPIAKLEPATAAAGHFMRLGDFGQSQQLTEKLPRLVLAAR